MKTYVEVMVIALATMGVLYIIDNKKQLKNSILKPVTKFMKCN